MALNLTTDLDFIYGENGDWARSATHINEFGVATTIYGIFDNDYMAVDTGIGSVAFSESNPRFYGKTDAFVEIKYGDKLEIGADTWIIKEIMPDGTGHTELALEKE